MAPMPDLEWLLVRTARHIAQYRTAAAAGSTFSPLDLDAVRAAVGGPLPEHPQAPDAVVDRLISGLEPASVATTGPRYLGFVVGGALPAATAADLLAVGWDQPAYNYLSSPAAAVVEEVAGAWLIDLLGLPAGATFGFVTGSQAAITVCLAAARHHVLAGAGAALARRLRPRVVPAGPGPGHVGRAAGAGTARRRRSGRAVLRTGPALRRQLQAVDGIAAANRVVLNQVLVRFADDDAATDRVLDAVQRSGECWMGATTWNGRRYMRISVSNHSTTDQDVDRAVRAIVDSYRSYRSGPRL